MRLGAESVEGVLTERGLFVVSEVLGNEDSVVKPIDFLTGRNLYQGATISGRRKRGADSGRRSVGRGQHPQ